jgi:quercetin 2,3-dioxygenase
MKNTLNAPSIKLRPSPERGHADHGWLDTYHTFSFANYQDRNHMGFRSLRVINEDRVAPGMGFGTHPHQDMEIITIVLEGELAHKDSMGNASAIRPDEIQRMSAGTGVSHSEFNNSPKNSVHLYQIWILPSKRGLEPSYEQKSFPAKEKKNTLKLVASANGREGSVTVHQDAELYDCDLDAGKEITYPLKKGRGVWLQVKKGQLQLNGSLLKEGDGAAIENEPLLRLTAKEDCGFLLFDLA